MLKNPLKMDRKLLHKIRNRRHGQKRTPGQELFIITLLFIQTVCLCIIGLGISAVKEQDKIRNTHFEPILNKLYSYIAGKANMTSLTCILCTQSI